MHYALCKIPLALGLFLPYIHVFSKSTQARGTSSGSFG